MPAYLISHRSGAHGDIHIEDDDLSVHFTNGWVIFADDHPTDASAVVLALPADQVASIQRIDPDPPGQATGDGPAPEG